MQATPKIIVITVACPDEVHDGASGPPTYAQGSEPGQRDQPAACAPALHGDDGTGPHAAGKVGHHDHDVPSLALAVLLPERVQRHRASIVEWDLAGPGADDPLGGVIDLGGQYLGQVRQESGNQIAGHAGIGQQTDPDAGPLPSCAATVRGGGGTITCPVVHGGSSPATSEASGSHALLSAR